MGDTCFQKWLWLLSLVSLEVATKMFCKKAYKKASKVLRRS